MADPAFIVRGRGNVFKVQCPGRVIRLNHNNCGAISRHQHCAWTDCHRYCSAAIRPDIKHYHPVSGS